MIELYNEGNIKVYVDSTEYYMEHSPVNPKLRLKDNSGKEIVRIYRRAAQGLTITIKGKTLAVEGITSATPVVGEIELNSYNLKLKGNFTIRVFTGNEEEPVTTTLYDEAQVLQYTARGEYNKVDYILHDKSILHSIRSDGQDPLKVYLYDNSICTLSSGEAEVYAYDSSKVTINSNDRKVIVNAYDNSKVEAREGVDVTINDESKLVRF